MSEEECESNETHGRSTFRQYLAAFIVNLCTFSIGTMIGWTSPMQPLLSSKTPPIGTEVISTETISWLGSINYIGAIVGCLFWGISTDHLGRKYTAMFVAIPLIFAWTLKLTAQNIWWLIIARFSAGISHGGGIINTPIYVTEIAEDRIRGLLGSLLLVFLNAGCVFSNVVGSLTSYHTLSSVCLCIPIIYLACLSFLPETPIYLWNKGKKDRSKQSLVWLRGGKSPDIVNELEVFKNNPNQSLRSPSLSGLFSSKGVRKAMIISIIMMGGQQLSGSLAILTYTFHIVQESGSFLSPVNSIIIITTLHLVAALLSTALMDRVGRRALLLFSFTLLAISLLTLGGYFYFKNLSLHSMVRSIPIVCVSTICICFSIGVGPVPVILISEIFTPNIRGFVISKILLFNFILAFFMIKTFPFISYFLGFHGCFFMYGIFCAISTLLMYWLVPETKGKSLQEILRILNGEEEAILKTSESSELVRSNKKAQIQGI